MRHSARAVGSCPLRVLVYQRSISCAPGTCMIWWPTCRPTFLGHTSRGGTWKWGDTRRSATPISRTLSSMTRSTSPKWRARSCSAQGPCVLVGRYVKTRSSRLYLPWLYLLRYFLCRVSHVWVFPGLASEGFLASLVATWKYLVLNTVNLGNANMLKESSHVWELWYIFFVRKSPSPPAYFGCRSEKIWDRCPGPRQYVENHQARVRDWRILSDDLLLAFAVSLLIMWE